MDLPHFLHWLSVTDLGGIADDELRDAMSLVLDSPAERGTREAQACLGEIAEERSASRLDRDRIASWPERYGEEFGQGWAPVESLEDDLQRRAEELKEAEVESPRLLELECCLSGLEQAQSPAETTQYWERLERLEAQMLEAYHLYADEPFPLDAVSSESLAGHRMLEEGFERWLEALDLAKVGQSQAAREAARDGNRLLRAVALWSAEVTTAGSSDSGGL